MADIAYAVHTETCTFLLDEEGVCLWLVSITGLSNALMQAAIGSQYVACVDVRVDGGLVGELTEGACLLFSGTSPETGRHVLLRSGPIVSVERRRPQATTERPPPPQPAPQPRPVAAQPRAAEAQPRPAAALPRPATAQPRPAAAQPRPAAAQPRPSPAQQRPAAAAAHQPAARPTHRHPERRDPSAPRGSRRRPLALEDSSASSITLVTYPNKPLKAPTIPPPPPPPPMPERIPPSSPMPLKRKRR